MLALSPSRARARALSLPPSLSLYGAFITVDALCDGVDQLGVPGIFVFYQHCL